MDQICSETHIVGRGFLYAPGFTPYYGAAWKPRPTPNINKSNSRIFYDLGIEK